MTEEYFWVEWRFADLRNDWTKWDSYAYPTRYQAAQKRDRLADAERVRIANVRDFRVVGSED
jgi:hypothetical protein